MNPSRNKEGFYSADSLRDGARDQYAVLRSYGKVVVEIEHIARSVRPWLVGVTITSTTNPAESRATYTGFSSLSEARREFNRLRRKHP